MPPTAFMDWTMFCPLVTHSVPTLIRGLQKAFITASASTPQQLQTLAAMSIASGSHCSSRPFCLNLETGFLSRLSRLCSLHLAHGHDGSGQPVAVPLVLLREAEDVKGTVSELQLLVVVDGCHGNFALRHVRVVLNEDVQINGMGTCLKFELT